MVGYVALLRRNRNFRRLWYGQVVSQLGDWLDSIALFTLMLRLTGSGQAVGLLLLAEFLPGAVVGPFAGIIVDRLPRKLVLIASDLGRAALVLLLLFVHSPADLWLLYVAVIAKMGLAACFEPARSSIIPSLCTREELVAANAISGATWSAMLALGAALGGLVAGTLGVTAAFLLDSLSFALSAALIATVRVDERGTKDTDPRGGKLEPSGEHAPQVFYHEAHEAHEGRTAADYAPCPAKTPVQPNVRPSSTLVHQVVDELREGLTYVFAHRELAWLTFNKAIWSLGGGVLLLLTLFGREVFPIGRDGAISIGLLYAARGVGAGLGPLLALRLGGNGDTFLRRAVGGAFLITGLGYAALSSTRSLPLAALAVLFAHIGGSIQWVFSTALLQTRVPDRLRGRVFATEYAALTLTTGLSAYATGLVRDAGVAPWALALGLAGIFGAAGALMLVVLWRGSPKAA